MIRWVTDDSRTTTLTAAAAAALCPPAAVFSLLVVPRMRSWGATPAELAQQWPGDELVPHPGLTWTNAVTVLRPADQVWPWVAQLGQGRGGLYSYDWLENVIGADVHSAEEVRPELQAPLAVGDRVIRMARYAPANPVARYDPGHALVLGGVGDDDAQLEAGRPSSSWAFIVQPLDSTTCRLVVRSRAGGLMPRVQGPIQFVMQRKMMLGIKERAEGTWAPSAGDVLVPLSWLVAAVVSAVHAGRAVRHREDGLAPAALAGMSASVLEGLLFWEVPGRSRAALVLALVRSLRIRPPSGPRRT